MRQFNLHNYTNKYSSVTFRRSLIFFKLLQLKTVVDRIEQQNIYSGVLYRNFGATSRNSVIGKQGNYENYEFINAGAMSELRFTTLVGPTPQINYNCIVQRRRSLETDPVSLIADRLCPQTGVLSGDH